MSPGDHVTEQEISGARHILNLMRSQLESRRFDLDYMLRQVDKLSTMMDGVEAMRQEQRSAARFEALYNVSRMLGTSLDRQTVLNQAMDAIIQLTGAERGFLMLRDDDGNLQVTVARNLDQKTLSSEQFQYSRTITNYVLDQGEGILTTNALEDPRFAGRESVVAQSLRSIMAAPLWVRGYIIGVAYVENRIVAGLFSEDDLNTLEALAGQISVAIDNATLFSDTDEALAKRVEQLRQLRRIDMRLNETLDPDEALEHTLRAVCSVTGATEGYIAMVQEGGAALPVVCELHQDQVRFHPDTVDTADTDISQRYPHAWQALERRETVVPAAGADQPPVMIVPLIREMQAAGVLVLCRMDEEPFTEDQQEIVERIITRAAVTIENAQLYARVQAANQAKSEFVGIVAHDLKAPMTNIRGYADLMLMQQEDLTPQHRQFLKRISDTVIRMERLVSDLADISRIESGQFLMETMQVTVSSVVDAARDTTLPEIQARGHHFVQEIAPDLPDMWVDYYRLIQVLTNLISNAYKYTPAGGTITLRAQAEGDAVRFSVTDTGIGMSEEDIRMLGTKFWRAEDDFTRSQPGSGLGFAITAALVEQMGGQIEVESQPGVGSTFSFTVPVYQGG